jgi:hypothetical protein
MPVFKKREANMGKITERLLSDITEHKGQKMPPGHSGSPVNAGTKFRRMVLREIIRVFDLIN